MGAASIAAMSETSFIHGREGETSWLREAAIEYVKAHAADLIIQTPCSACNGLALTSFAATVTAERSLFPFESVPGEEDAEVLLLRDGDIAVGAVLIRSPDAESDADEHLAEDVTEAIDNMDSGATPESVQRSVENGLMPLYELDTDDVLSGEERIVVNILEGAWYCASCERPPDSDCSGSESDESEAKGRRDASDSEDSAETTDEEGGPAYDPLIDPDDSA